MGNLLDQNEGLHIKNLRFLYYQEVSKRWLDIAMSSESKIKLVPNEIACGIRNEYLIWPVGKLVVQKSGDQFKFRSEYSAERLFNESALKNYLKIFLFDSEISELIQDFGLDRPRSSPSVKWLEKHLRMDDLGNSRELVPFLKWKIAEEILFRVETFEEDDIFEVSLVVTTSLASHSRNSCFENHPVIDFGMPEPVGPTVFDLDLRDGFWRSLILDIPEFVCQTFWPVTGQEVELFL